MQIIFLEFGSYPGPPYIWVLIQTNHMKTFIIKITYENGHNQREITAKNFGEACLKAYKIETKLFRVCTGFELVSQTNAQ